MNTSRIKRYKPLKLIIGGIILVLGCAYFFYDNLNGIQKQKIAGINIGVVALWNVLLIVEGIKEEKSRNYFIWQSLYTLFLILLSIVMIKDSYMK